jgi:hypothetical protein
MLFFWHGLIGMSFALCDMKFGRSLPTPVLRKGAILYEKVGFKTDEFFFLKKSSPFSNADRLHAKVCP